VAPNQADEVEGRQLSVESRQAGAARLTDEQRPPRVPGSATIQHHPRPSPLIGTPFDGLAMAQESKLRQRTSGGVVVGALCGWAVVFFGMLASMLTEPPEHFGVQFPLPNFWAADPRWRLMLLVGALIATAVIGGVGGGIAGRVGYVLARRGVPRIPLRLGLSLVGAAGGFGASSSRIIVVATVVASAAATLLGAVIGNGLASSAFRSASGVPDPMSRASGPSDPSSR
jgi:hypothetical protein